MIIPVFVMVLGVSLEAQNSSGLKNSTYQLMLRSLLDESVDFITVADLAEEEELILLDTRAYEEYEVSHIKGAIWVGYDEFQPKMIEEFDKNLKVVVYCSVGYRSEKIGERLKSLGFVDVYNLYGGIFEWINKDQPVYDIDNNLTDDVHAYSREWGIWLDKGEKVY